MHMQERPDAHEAPSRGSGTGGLVFRRQILWVANRCSTTLFGLVMFFFFVGRVSVHYEICQSESFFYLCKYSFMIPTWIALVAIVHVFLVENALLTKLGLTACGCAARRCCCTEVKPHTVGNTNCHRQRIWLFDGDLVVENGYKIHCAFKCFKLSYESFSCFQRAIFSCFLLAPSRSRSVLSDTCGDTAMRR